MLTMIAKKNETDGTCPPPSWVGTAEFWMVRWEARRHRACYFVPKFCFLAPGAVAAPVNTRPGTRAPGRSIRATGARRGLVAAHRARPRGRHGRHGARVVGGERRGRPRSKQAPIWITAVAGEMWQPEKAGHAQARSAMRRVRRRAQACSLPSLR